MAYHPYPQSESRGSQSDNRFVEEPFHYTPVQSPYEGSRTSDSPWAGPCLRCSPC
jgi:hypothetical protein